MNVVEQIYLAAGAKLTYTKLQLESQHAFHISNLVAQLKQASTLHAVHIGRGAKIARDDVNIALTGSDAACYLHGLGHPDQQRLLDYHSRIDHLVANTNSTQRYKALVADKARGVFNGKVVVAPNAQKISAQQKSESLLLSKNAEIDAKPELEIYADDVKCSHGATVGQLDEKILFYLRTRGIAEQQARMMLTAAFAQDIFNALSHEPTKKYIEERANAYEP